MEGDARELVAPAKPEACLNSTMLTVALPGVVREFSVGAGEASLIVSLYLGTVALVSPVGGLLGDRFGPRSTFLVGVAANAIASLIAMLANSLEALEAARIVQAVSAALTSTAAAAMPAWCDERVKGVAETSRNPLA